MCARVSECERERERERERGDKVEQERRKNVLCHHRFLLPNVSDKQQRTISPNFFIFIMAEKQTTSP